jgi:UDP-3-O-[3-hydroxymyristoyl] glucosamine N-acyltransferase
MNLTELFDDNKEYEIYRDGEFSTMGLNSANSGKKTLAFIEEQKYIDRLSDDISCVITKKEYAAQFPEKYGVLLCEKPRQSFFWIHNEFAHNAEYVRKNIKTEIGYNTNINKMTEISDRNVIIGNNVIIEAFVVIRENTIIGENSIIRTGTIIGGEGFEFKKDSDRIMAVKHLGGVKIGCNVEVQQNSCIDKAVFPWDDTVVDDYVKIDNHVHLGHACKIGNNTLIAANSTIGGRTEIGSDTWLGISCTVSNNLTIGQNSFVGLGAVVINNVPSGKAVFGVPARIFRNTDEKF